MGAPFRIVRVVAYGFFWGSVLLSAAQINAAEQNPLRDAIYQHNKAVLDSQRAKYGGRYEAEDYVVDGKYKSVRVDLNDDKMADAIVLFDGPGLCGSGSCTLEVYRGTKTGFEFLSSSTITVPPIRVMSEKRYGWKTLVVFSGGTGNVLLRFNGSRYPFNPSLQPKATELQISTASIVLERER